MIGVEEPEPEDVEAYYEAERARGGQASTLWEEVMFQMYLTRRADRELKRLPPDVKERVKEKIGSSPRTPCRGVLSSSLG